MTSEPDEKQEGGATVNLTPLSDGMEVQIMEEKCEMRNVP